MGPWRYEEEGIGLAWIPQSLSLFVGCSLTLCGVSPCKRGRERERERAAERKQSKRESRANEKESEKEKEKAAKSEWDPVAACAGGPYVYTPTHTHTHLASTIRSASLG